MPDNNISGAKTADPQRLADIDKPIQSDPLGNLVVSAISAPIVGLIEMAATGAGLATVYLGHVMGEGIVATGELVEHAHSAVHAHVVDQSTHLSYDPSHDGASHSTVDSGSTSDQVHHGGDACYDPGHDGASHSTADSGSTSDQVHHGGDACYDPGHDGASHSTIDSGSTSDQVHHGGEACYDPSHDGASHST